MSENQIHKYIFHAGFSTAEKVTNVSGRGVGMDVVRTNIEVIGGTIDLKSVEGVGTTFTIKIPLTLAIVSTLIVEAAGERFAIPQLAVVELVRVQKGSEHRIERIKETPVLRLRNKLLPLSHLSDLLLMPKERAIDEADLADDGFIVVMQVGNQTFGIVVDAVFHTEEIVVKPMATALRNITMFSGNTILGDGSVIMIIDPNGIAQGIGSSIAEDVANEGEEAEERSSVSRESTSLLVFRAGGEDPKAVPLSLVTRLEEIKVSDIEHSNGRDLVQNRGQLMPLIQVDENSCVRSEGTQPLLVFSDADHSMGLVVDEIVDIVDAVLDIEVSSETPGILGSGVIKDRATEILDVGYYLPLAFPDWFASKEKETAMPREQTVLLVDDSAFFRNMLAPVLKSAGYRVVTKDSADAAWEMMQGEQQFSAIISDIEMPGMNGFEFCEAIRGNQRYKDVPVVALSSHASNAAIERAREAGFTDYVAKFDRPGLIAALKEQAPVRVLETAA